MSDQETVESTPAQDPVAPEVTEIHEQQGTQIDDPAELKKQLDKARAEAAKYRTERSELKDAADKWAEYKEAQKTEQERIAEQNAALQAELERATLQNLQTKAALTYGLDPEDLDLLGSGDADTIDARAKRLQALHQAATIVAPPSNSPQPSLKGAAGEAEKEEPDTRFPASWRI